MNEKSILANKDIKAEITIIIIKNFKRDIKVSTEFIKHNSGIIIAAALSMIIFLLSLIPQRTLLLDIGIIFIVISIIFQYELFNQASKVSSRLIEKNPLLAFKRMKNQNFWQIFGPTSFFLGLLFIFSHFRLFYISFGLLFYLNFKCLWKIKSFTVLIRRIKTERIEHRNRWIRLITIDIGRKILNHFKIILLFEVILEVIIIVCSVLVIISWILLGFTFV